MSGPFVQAPTTPTDEQIEIGRAVLEAEFGGASGRILAEIARDVYREMIEARPTVPPPRFGSFTAAEQRHFTAMHELAQELGRYPSGAEVGARLGITKQSARYTRNRLAAKGYVRLKKNGRIRSLKPLG